MKLNNLQKTVIVDALIRHKDLVRKVDEQVNVPSYPELYRVTLNSLIKQLKDE